MKRCLAFYWDVHTAYNTSKQLHTMPKTDEETLFINLEIFQINGVLMQQAQQWIQTGTGEITYLERTPRRLLTPMCVWTPRLGRRDVRWKAKRWCDSTNAKLKVLGLIIKNEFFFIILGMLLFLDLVSPYFDISFFNNWILSLRCDSGRSSKCPFAAAIISSFDQNVL